MADNDKLMNDDERYLSEGREDDGKELAKTSKKKPKVDKNPGQVSWRFFAGLSAVFFGLGVQAVPPGEENWLLMYIVGTLVQIAACVFFFMEFSRLSATAAKKWKTYTLAVLIFLSLAAGVALGVVLTQYI